MVPGNYNITFARGATFGPITLTLLDTDDTPVDITGWTVEARAKNQLGELEIPAVISDGAGGEITMSMTDTQTEALPKGYLKWKLMLENTEGERHGPYVAGDLTITDL